MKIIQSCDMYKWKKLRINKSYQLQFSLSMYELIVATDQRVLSLWKQRMESSLLAYYSHFMSAVVLSNSSGQPFVLSSSTSKGRIAQILHTATSFLCENNQLLDFSCFTMAETMAMVVSEQRRNPQLSYKSDIIFISGKQTKNILD